MTKRPKRPADVIGNAIRVAQVEAAPTTSPAAAELGRLGGRKVYGPAPESLRGRYSPAEFVTCHREKVTGNPDDFYISTSYVERQNLNMRMGMRRFTRLTNALSKKLENHYHALSLYFVFYNFVRIHKTLRMTPAMAAGVTNTLMSWEDIAAIVDAANPMPAVRGPYRKRATLIA